MSYPPRNIERIRAILEHIEAHPETWYQARWHCGTTHCFAGHAQIAAGKAPDDDTASADAREWLSLTRAEADWYFSPKRTLSELRTLLEPLDSNGFDRDGYNRQGFDRNGYNRDGYDHGGYDHSGFNRAGFNREGRGRDGFDWEGYDRQGYNREGFDRNGYNRDGYDRFGYVRKGFDRLGNRRQETQS